MATVCFAAARTSTVEVVLLTDARRCVSLARHVAGWAVTTSQRILMGVMFERARFPRDSREPHDPRQLAAALAPWGMLAVTAALIAIAAMTAMAAGG